MKNWRLAALYPLIPIGATDPYCIQDLAAEIVTAGVQTLEAEIVTALAAEDAMADNGLIRTECAHGIN